MHVRLHTRVRAPSTSACEQCVCICAVFVCGATAYCAGAVLWLVVPRVVVVVLVVMTVRAAVWHEAAAQAHRRLLCSMCCIRVACGYAGFFWVLSTQSSALLCTCVSSTELQLAKATAWMLEQQLAESQQTNDALQADLVAFKLH